MLRQVNIDGVLYKIGDSRFEGDNLAYIQLPETITVGTPLTDLAPIQKALDSTDGSLLYAPSLNVFFAPTASNTPATTRIWASTTGDKGYQLKATLNESGILSSAVVVEAPAGEGAYIIEYDDLDCIFVTDPTTLVTTPEAIALAQGIVDHRDCPIYIHINVIPTLDDYLLLSHYSLNGVNENLCYHFVADKCVFLENARIEINVRIDGASGSINGGSCYSNAFSFENYKDLLEASEALAADKKYVDTELAIKIAKLLKNSVNPSIGGNIIWKYNTNTFINTKHEWDEDEECDVDTFEMPTKVDDNVLGGTLIYPITVYSQTEGNVTTYLGAVVKPPTTDHVVVSKEYMEVPTGHASHPCLEASISGTTLNITHKNESHISSVIHVPKSLLFTSDNAFKLKFSPLESPYTLISGTKIEVSTNGIDWKQPTWDTTDGITCVAKPNPELSKYCIFIRSNSYTYDASTNIHSHFTNVSGSNIKVQGILDAMWGGKPMVGDAAYSLFKNMTGLTDAEKLVFPETTARNCYRGMFEGCTSLVAPPKLLPAKIIAEGSYGNMFKGCTSLTKSPLLMGEKIGDHGYGSMFYNCTSFIEPPALSAINLTSYCYYSMFFGCTSMTTVPELPATELKQSCYQSMFYRCESLVEVPKLPALTLQTDCYDSMFGECISLTKTPELPATVLAEGCYSSMFTKCTSLRKPVTFPKITTLAKDAMKYMFMRCSNIKWATLGVPYIINTSDTSMTPAQVVSDMFGYNGGSPLPETSGTPKFNTTYYLDI